jgi:hypothetical protein
MQRCSPVGWMSLFTALRTWRRSCRRESCSPAHCRAPIRATRWSSIRDIYLTNGGQHFQCCQRARESGQRPPDARPSFCTHDRICGSGSFEAMSRAGSIGLRMGTSRTLLAVAGLERLGLISQIDLSGEMHRIHRFHSGPGIVVLAPETMVPAAGQGIIAVTARADDRRTLSLLVAINDRATWVAARAERAVLRALGGNCRTPIGAYARVLPNRELLLTAMAARVDGSFLIKRWRRGPAAEANALGAELGASLRRVSPEDLFHEQLPASAGTES